MDRTQSVLDFYKDYARPFLNKHKTDRVGIYDGQLEKLRKAISTRHDPIHACFLGISGIGKSTLLNALIANDKTVLPAGGIGPLTAQAITVKYGDKSSFKVEYHDRGRINRLRFALEQFYKAEKKEERRSVEAASEEPAGLEEDFKQEINEMLYGDGDERKREKKENLIKQARLMITNKPIGDQDLSYLIDGIRAIHEERSAYASNLAEEDLKRIVRLREAIKKGSAEYAGDEDAAFRENLNSHAAGYFAPIIRTLEVCWNSDLLKTGLVLVDLPGIGIAGDPLKERTAEYLREKAKAVILVVPKSGETEADAAALRESGFLNRLLYSIDDPSADPVKLVVAVTRVDDVAEQRYRDDPQRRKKKWEHLQDVISETAEYVKTQKMNQLKKEWAADDDTLSEKEQKVLSEVESSLRVIPVSAPEYRKFCANDEEDRPFIKKLAQSNVPKLQELLNGLADEVTQERSTRLNEHAIQLSTSLKNEINLIEAEWLGVEGSREEQEKLEKELDAFIQPLRDEYKNREGAFRNYLRKTIPIQVKALVNEACTISKGKIDRYLVTLRDAHWGTLRASVRRGGAFDGARTIDLPNDFALKFEAPIAEIWDSKLLKEIRKETHDFAKDCVAPVEDVVKWSRGQGTRISGKALEALLESIRTDASGMNMVGKEAIEELRKSVIEKMIKTIKAPIKRKCDAFVERGDSIGPGVKRRILELFDTLSEEAVAAAKEPATELINERFREVEKEILDSFKKFEDPLKSIRETIIGTNRKDLERRNKKARETILQDIKIVKENMPRESQQALSQ